MELLDLELAREEVNNALLRLLAAQRAPKSVHTLLVAVLRTQRKQHKLPQAPSNVSDSDDLTAVQRGVGGAVR